MLSAFFKSSIEIIFRKQLFESVSVLSYIEECDFDDLNRQEFIEKILGSLWNCSDGGCALGTGPRDNMARILSKSDYRITQGALTAMLTEHCSHPFHLVITASRSWLVLSVFNLDFPDYLGFEHFPLYV